MPAAASKLFLAGYYGCGNAGDEAVLAGLLAELQRSEPEIRVVVASGDPAWTEAEHDVEAVPREDLPAVVEAMRGCRLMVLGGGGLLNDYWPVPLASALTASSGGLPFYVGHLVLAAGLDVPAALCAIGVGPLDTAEGRELTRSACALAGTLGVRDPGSLEELRRAGVAAADLARVEVTADPAWRLPPLPARELPRVLAEVGLDDSDRPVAVALRPWGGAAAEEACVAAVAEALRTLPGLPPAPERPILLLSFDRADEPLHRRLAAALAGAGRVVHVAGRSPAELAALLGRCRVALAMRYHAALLATAAGSPVAALAYDPKVAFLMADLGMPQLCLAAPEWDAARIRSALAAAPAHPARADLARTVDVLGQRAARNAALLLAPAPATRHGDRQVLARVALARGLGSWRLEHQLSDLTAEADTLRGQLAQVREQLAQIREQRSLLMAERADLERRLDELLGTVGYRLLSRFWSAMRWSFPAGSRRRRLYRWGRDLTARLVGGGEAAARAPSSHDAPPVQDLRLQLAEFADRVTSAAPGPVVLVLSGTQLRESEGQRPTRLALALARRGVPVVFAYWRWDEQQPAPQDRLDQGILQLPLDVVASQHEAVLDAFPGMRRLLLVEMPWPGLFATVARANAAGWVTVYDVLDDWEEFHRVGQAEWFDPAFERHLITACDAVFAVNAFLAGRVRELGGLGAQVLGNGLEAGIERVGEPRPLARGEVTVGYFGYLAGAWFDWALLAEAARRRPGWRFYLIGYGGSPEGVELPANVTLLGRRPHHELAAYAANWDVAVVPFKGDRLAAGADPIKTYEYLAMGLPVVTTGAPPPAGAEPFVRRAESLEGFLTAIEAAAAERGDAAGRVAFAHANPWDSRVDSLLRAVDDGAQRIAEKRALCGA